MKLCELPPKLFLRKKGTCKSCLLKENSAKEAGTFSMDDIIPTGLCPFAYFSIIPYYLSFKHDAWFRWRKNKNDVVCQCPRPNGVVFLISKSDKGKEKIINAEVKNAGMCPLDHKIRQVFEISNNIFCPALFPSLWSQIDNLINKSEIEVACSISPDSIHISSK